MGLEMGQVKPLLLGMLHNEILLEIFDFIPRRELKTLRLVCPRFNGLLYSRLLSAVKFSIALPDEAQFCRRHGWYMNLAGKYYPCHGERVLPTSIGDVLRRTLTDIMCSNCPFFLSEEARCVGKRNHMTNPIMRSMSRTLAGLENWRLTMVFASTRIFRIEIKHIQTICQSSKLPVDREALFRMFTNSVLPKLLDAMPALERLLIDLHPDYITANHVPRAVEAVWALMSSKHPEAQIHVAVKYHTHAHIWELFPTNLVRCLYGSGLSSLTLGLVGARDEVLPESLNQLVITCPRLRQPGCIRELITRKGGSHWNTPRAFLYLGPEKERSNEWYVRGETERERTTDRECSWDLVEEPTGEKLIHERSYLN